MKFNLQKSVESLIGKTFKSSEFRSGNESYFDTFDCEVKLKDFNPVGKVILNAFVATRCGDIGIGLAFADNTNPLFFYASEEIEVD